MVHSPDFPPESSLFFYYQELGCLFLIKSMAPVEQLGDNILVVRWHVLLAAIWQWYLPLCICITFFITL